MPCLFYQRDWSIVVDDIVAATQSFFRGNYLLKKLNLPFITLIPKNEHAANVHNYRPSLCNVTYKIISKILASRLRGILHNKISPLQAAFNPGRSVHDNSIIGHEIMHFLSHHKCRKHYAAIKNRYGKGL